MDYVLVSDLARYYIVVLAMWLIAILIRLTAKRLKNCGGWRCLFKRQSPPHPLSTLGLAVLMFAAILRRFDNMGTPGDALLWIVFVSITMIGAGVLTSVQFTVTPPWKRHNAH